MKNKGELAGAESESWTRAEDYLGAMARHRTARQKREPIKRRTQTDEPHFLLSTLPFLLLMGALLVIAVGMMIMAWTIIEGAPQPSQKADQHQQGYAAKGWFQKAQKDFH
jgi:hypothetical protein